jgi:D-galactonate transporter
MVEEKALISKVGRRLIPFLFFCYILNYLDRFNISFAALEMKSDLAFSDAVYGFGAGIFFLGYVVFEVPSNLLMEKIGARIWIARIMVTWGIISSCMMLVKTPLSFYLLRFFLGVAEAGFFPGIIFYLTYWIPERERAKTFALFLTSTSLAGVFGGPLSAALMNMHGSGGLRGWQWLFLLEGIPSILLGIFTLFYLTDKPRDASWLSEEEKTWLEKTIEVENRVKRERHPLTLRESLLHPRVWRLCFLYFSIIISFYGMAFWLPQIVKSFSGLGNAAVSLLSALPYLAASVVMVMTANHSDKTQERRWHVAVPAIAAAASLVLGAFFQAGHPWLAFLMICATATGIWSTLGPFWSMPTLFLTGTSAAGGIALINSVGNVGGFVGPFIIGAIKETTHKFENGMLFLAITLLTAALLALSVKKEHA